MKRLFWNKGVTMIELLVVLVVISILSTISVGVYTNNVTRARFSKARAEIQTLETAITQYQIDVGTLPPSGIGTELPPTGITTTSIEGSGYLQAALRSSLSGDFRNPLDDRWQGPYMDWDYNRLGYIDTSGELVRLGGGDDGSGAEIPEVSFLDPWDKPYIFISNEDYGSFPTANLPSSNPFAATETWYNPSTFQIISKGPNGTTLGGTQIGTDADDVTNFSTSNL